MKRKSKKQICEYCLRESDKLVKEHFIPQSLGGRTWMDRQNKITNIYSACVFCDNSKRGRAFWSVFSFREFVRKKIEQPTLKFERFVKEKLKLAIQKPEKRYLLKLAFDDVPIEIKFRKSNYAEKKKEKNLHSQA